MLGLQGCPRESNVLEELRDVVFEEILDSAARAAYTSIV
jgi:hypothetical protein